MSDALPPALPMVLRPGPGELWWIKPLLAIGMLGDFTLQIIIAFWIKDSTMMNAMQQTTTNALMVVLGFYFGSSSSSARKDQIIAAAPPVSTEGTKP